MTFSIESVLNLEAKGRMFLGPFDPHSLCHKSSREWAFPSNKQKDGPVSFFAIKEGVVCKIPLKK